MRQDPGLDSLWGRQPAELSVCAGQRGGADIRFFAGYYPLVKPKFEHIRPALLRGLCKLLLCNGGILLLYGLVLLLIPGGSISQEMRTTALAVSLTTLAMGNVAFLLYDRALHNMLQAYRILWQPRLHKMLGR